MYRSIDIKAMVGAVGDKPGWDTAGKGDGSIDEGGGWSDGGGTYGLDEKIMWWLSTTKGQTLATLYPLIWVGISPPTYEYAMGSQRPVLYICIYICIYIYMMVYSPWLYWLNQDIVPHTWNGWRGVHMLPHAYKWRGILNCVCMLSLIWWLIVQVLAYNKAGRL